MVSPKIIASRQMKERIEPRAFAQPISPFSVRLNLGTKPPVLRQIILPSGLEAVQQQNAVDPLIPLGLEIFLLES